MTPETLEALKGSIEKWRRIVEEDGSDHATSNCPLCQLFFWDHDCMGCPVFETTQLTGCRATPYDRWADLTDDNGGRADTLAKLETARAELDFLRSLLPKEEAP